MKTAVVLTIAVLANSLGNVFLSKGMQGFDAESVSAAGWLPQAARHVFTNPWMMAGVLLLIVFLSAYLSALSWADLSFVLPATAPAYILTAILAAVFLNETISPARWAGTLLIVAGTSIVARTQPSTSRPSR
jgi:drug/metabolite transporter (DMT)-like permease